MATIFLLVGIAFLLVAIHPFTTYPWSLVVLHAAFPKTRKRGSPTSVGELSCAVCVCAYNEERIIEQKVQNLLALRAREPGLEILVYVDAATDGTTEILRRHAGSIDYLHVATERHGKTHGMNLLTSRARASVLVFTDANVMMDVECVSDLKAYFADPEIGCVCGNLVYSGDATSGTASSGSFYWRFEEALKRLEMQTGSMIGADGSVFAIRRELHRPPPDDLIDDMYVSLMILCAGYRVVQASDARAYEESVGSPREEFRRKIRIACQAFNVHRAIWPHIRKLDWVTRYKYVSHKLIRWLTIYLLAISALAFEAAMIVSNHVLSAAVLTGGLVVALVIGRLGHFKLVSQVSAVLAAFLGTGIGIWRSLCGERYQTWTPAASIRRPR